MKEYEIKTKVREYGIDELDGGERKLVEIAREMTRSSYAPYSKFHVGAAIELEDGEIVKGSNQENAAYPSGTCAERTACYQASALHPGKAMKRIAIAAWTREGHDEGDSWEDCFQEKPIAPCGACRQALLEYETLYGDIEVLLYGKRGVLKLASVKELLPLAFTEF